uniref:RNA 3'-terminal phosphate cyclase domain-containing protein n=1 Tax=Chromera velia CCMP2878 TaxID=1169474 RepID=A0A0G4I2Z9_9ALVE|eukprot:Cvel_10548.t1-p1 / transcript=Cvel_10548.t1 / gene=Cvel_10548 / organism=Chromera_velia_CCMP2878 / gene_product=RNA 3'-terminal phosphate cyclase, putative / transcript_product=RNA 3'-terminal phosphate cyclase, putative / location=Cvel_scaffold638:67506-71168(+) / protein_length=440 / sequence_SO=supercontig / SO=protein_coding / is_pseudo=false
MIGGGGDGTVWTDVDGSLLEGGGQILRNSAAYSVIFNRPVRVFNIRAKRKNPGLAAQHLASLQLVADVCGASDGFEGGYVGSCQIGLRPSKLEGGSFEADPGTAGSISLMIQASLPTLLFAGGETHLTLQGGTDVSFSPSVNYLAEALFPRLRQMGASVDMQVVKRGLFPKGGGKVKLQVQPLKEPLRPIELNGAFEGIDASSGRLRGGPSALTEVSVRVFGAGNSDVVAEAESAKHSAIERCGEKLQRGEWVLGEGVGDWGSVKLSGQVDRLIPGQSVQKGVTGTGVDITVKRADGSVYHSCIPTDRKERVGDTVLKAADALDECLGGSNGRCPTGTGGYATVDEHLQDQLILPMALANGRSRMLSGPPTLHTQTAIHIASLFTSAKFTIRAIGAEAEYQDLSCRGLHVIECDGIGFSTSSENPGGIAASATSSASGVS